MKMKKEKSWNRYILDAYNERPIAYIPALARISESVTAGLFLSQMLFWCGKGKDVDWTYKTIDDLQEETYLRRNQQDNAVKIWMTLGVLEKERRGVPPKRYFRINLSALEELLDIEFQIAKSSNSESRNEQNTNTESTTEKTYRYPSGRTAPTPSQPKTHII